MFKILLICAVIGLAAAGDSDAHAEVQLRTEDVRPDGFDSALKTSNGIDQSQSGDVHGNIKGNFGWISPEGEHVGISYVADENGYQPHGDVLPTPHPIPEEIQRALAWIAAHPPKPEQH